MNNIKDQLNFICFLMLALVLGFGYLGYDNNRKMDQAQINMDQSLKMRRFVQSVNKGPLKKQDEKTLKAFKKRVVGKKRREALSNLIQAYNSRNPKLYGKRVQEFEQIEYNFFKSSQGQMVRSKKALRLYLILGTILTHAGPSGFGLLS